MYSDDLFRALSAPAIWQEGLSCSGNAAEHQTTAQRTFQLRQRMPES